MVYTSEAKTSLQWFLKWGPPNVQKYIEKNLGNKDVFIEIYSFKLVYKYCFCICNFKL